MGHPKVHVLNKEVNWTCFDDQPYACAIIKAFVIPPRNNNVIPVLPLKMDDRLLFPRCFTCSKKYPNGGVIDGYCCDHTDLERGWVSTISSIELDEALSIGYKVILMENNAN